MEEIILYTILAVLGVVIVLGIILSLLLSYIIFTVLLKRTSSKKWGHGVSKPDDPEIVGIYNGGSEWRDRYAENRRSVEIVSDGLKLYGEYFDFGGDKAVIIMPGRMECCVYACYFAEPYRRLGCNVLVIDARAHGYSEGKYNYVGYREYMDVLKWGEWLHDNALNKSIILHGICIGANTSTMTLTSPDCPDYFSGMIVEGIFTTFFDSFKNHMKADKRPIFPFLYICMFYIRTILGIDPVNDGPENRIKDLKKPVLFIHGRQDAFSLPSKMEELYELCDAPKRLVWFEKGKHSRLRINNVEEYDKEVIRFVCELERELQENVK